MTVIYNEAAAFTTELLNQITDPPFSFPLGPVTVRVHPSGRLAREKLHFRDRHEEWLTTARFDLEIIEPKSDPWWTRLYLAVDDWGGAEKNEFENGMTHYLLLFDRYRRSAHQISLRRFLERNGRSLCLYTDVPLPHRKRAEARPIVDWLLRYGYGKLDEQFLQLGTSASFHKTLVNLLRLGLIKQHRRGNEGHVISTLMRELLPLTPNTPGSASLYPKPSDPVGLGMAIENPEEDEFEIEFDLESGKADQKVRQKDSAPPSLADVTGLRKTEPPQPEGTRQRSRRSRVKVDFLELHEQNKEQGDAGEELVLKYERERLRRDGRPDLADKVQHTAREEGDGAGYDILSYFPTGKPLYIEVKTTADGPETPFYVTATELAFSSAHKGAYRLYRVYAYDARTKTARFFVLRGDLTAHCDAAHVLYRATLKPTNPER